MACCSPSPEELPRLEGRHKRLETQQPGQLSFVPTISEVVLRFGYQRTIPMPLSQSPI